MHHCSYTLILSCPFFFLSYFCTDTGAANIELVAAAESDEGAASETRLFGMWSESTGLKTTSNDRSRYHFDYDLIRVLYCQGAL